MTDDTPDDESSDGRIKGAWQAGSDASRGTAEAAGGYAASAIYAVAKLLGMIIDGVLIFLRATVLGFLSKIPKIGPQVADGLITAGNKMKLGNADVICNVIYGDGVVTPRKAMWESEKTAYVTDNDETFYAKGIGYDPKRLNGKVPVVWALRAGAEITEPLEAAIGTARKHNRFEEFRRPTGEPDVAVDIDPDGLDRGPGVPNSPAGAARTDGGGATAAGLEDLIGQSAGGAQAGARDEYDGLVVSYRDAHEMFGSKVTQEEMQQQETRGKLAALNMKDLASNWKYILALLAAFALGLWGPSIAGQIAGGGGEAISGGLQSFGMYAAPALSHVMAAVPGVLV